MVPPAYLSPLPVWPIMILDQILRVATDVVTLVVMLLSLPVRIIKGVVGIGVVAPAKQYKSILITGASSGIGEGLALSFAAPGVRLILVARSQAGLNRVAASCRERGATCEVRPVPLADCRASVSQVVSPRCGQLMSLTNTRCSA